MAPIIGATVTVMDTVTVKKQKSPNGKIRTTTKETTTTKRTRTTHEDEDDDDVVEVFNEENSALSEPLNSKNC